MKTKRIKRIIVLTIIAFIVISVIYAFHIISLPIFCWELGMGISDHIEENNGRIEYNLLSSKYRRHITRDEYYSMDIFELYARINEISESVNRIERPQGSSDGFRHASQTFYANNMFIYNSVDVHFEWFLLFPRARIIYWYIDMTIDESNGERDFSNFRSFTY